MRIVTNHWGWSLRGIGQWLRLWAWPIEIWGIEVTGSSPQRFVRRVKIGPVCFGFGFMPNEPEHAPPDATFRPWLGR